MNCFVAIAAFLAVAYGAHMDPRAFLGRHSAKTLAELRSVELPPPIKDQIEIGSLSLTVTPSVLNPGQDAWVSFSNVASPTASDFITVSCGPTQGLNDYLDKASVPTPVQSNGTVMFPNLIWMRCNFTFVYVSMATGSAVGLDSAVGVMGVALGAPTHGHISLTDNDDEMLVTYLTGTTTTPSVRYGVEPGSLSFTVFGSTSTYTASNLCNSPGNTTFQVWFRDPGYIHRVLLGNLTAQTIYYYQFGNDIDGWSQTFQFLSKPEAGFSSVNFLCYADMGYFGEPAGAGTAQNINSQVDNGYNNFLLHHGDISYAMGQGWVWDQWFPLIQPYSTRVPYMVTVGNHEYDYTSGGNNDPSHAGPNGFHPSWGNYGDDSVGECGVPMVSRFSTPTNGNGLFWWSMNYGNVHVIMYSTEHNFTIGSEQYLWLEQDLQNVNRSLTPWIVVAGHRMMYTTQLPGPNPDTKVSVALRENVEPLMYKYQVNLYFDGHQHSFERSCQVYRNECLSDGTGTVYVTIGTAGANLEAGGFGNQLGNWSVAHTEQYGFTRVQVTQDSMTVQYVLNTDGEIYDEVVLKPWPDSQDRQQRLDEMQMD